MIVGRRGPAQAAFTNPELLELGELTEADVVVDPEDVKLDSHSARSVEGEGEITPRRNVEILNDYAQLHAGGQARGRACYGFLARPVTSGRRQGGERSSWCATSCTTAATGVCSRRGPREEHETIEAGIVFRSIGYRGVPIDGVPFDEWKGAIPNEGGRVVDPHEQHAIPGEYVVGWIKRGPSGVIGTNKRDAQETVDHLIEDLHEGRLPQPAGDGGLSGGGRGLPETRAQARPRDLRWLGG